MKLLTIFALLGLSLAADYEKEDGVLVLGKDDFDQAVKEFDFLLAEFYAPWCGHCKSLAPEYAKAAQELAAENENIALAKIDATVHSGLGSRFGVRGYPTLKWFKKDPENAMEYKGGRTHKEIVAWINKKTGPIAKTIDDVDSAKNLFDSNEVVVFGYFPKGLESATKMTSAADSFEDLVPFAITSNADVAKEFDIAEGGITLFKQFDEKMNKYEGTDGGEDLVKFVKENMMAVVTEFTDKSAPKIFGGDIKKHVLLFSAASADTHETEYAAFHESAKNFKGQTLFVFVDCEKGDNSRVLEFFDIDAEKDCSDVRFIEMAASEMSKYIPESKDMTTEGFTNFVQGVLDGKIAKHLKSEEIPEKNDDPVFYLVGKQFEEICYDENKSVLVEFYAPWCGHCKQLAPVWDQLGEKFKDNEDIIIAKSDGTANEFDGIEISGYPTIKFFPKGEKKIVARSAAPVLLPPWSFCASPHP